MDVNTALSGQDLARTKVEVDTFNKTVNQGKAFKPTLDRDDFLKLLITQLQHQDPSQPMQDKEFIAQMAQFSSLEQITNMSQGFSKLSGLLASSEAAGFLGKTVEVQDGGASVTGTVTEVVRGDHPLVGINGKYYDLDQVQKIVHQEG
ncbi:MAG: flagellar hook assembly protein FlgD [Treponema sp.]|nr:flagellar hook assembly protein FlgD [Treponema sp.]